MNICSYCQVLLHTFYKIFKNFYIEKKEVVCYNNYKVMKFLFFICIILLFSCSSKLDKQLLSEKPKIIFQDANIIRYEDNKKIFLVKASFLENYPTKKIIAVKDLDVVQYNKNNASERIRLKVSSKSALFLQAENLYFFGEKVFLQLLEKKITVNAKNLFYNKLENMLYAAEGETVNVTNDDGSEITGTNFVANTLSNEFKFGSSIKGKIQTKEDNNSNF